MDNFVILALLAIAAYTAFSIYIGLGKGYSQETTSSARGYFIGGGTGYFILFFTTAATWFSTWIYMGAPGSFYKHGIGWIAGMTWQLFILYLMGTYGPRFWRLSKSNEYITPGELIGDYYQSASLQKIASGGQLIFCIPYLMAQVTGVGLAVSSITSGVIPFWGGVLYAALVVGIYVFFGGFQSQSWVDTMQAIMFVVILIISVGIMMFQIEEPGVAGFFAQLEQVNENLLYYVRGDQGYWTWKMYLSFFFIQAIGGYFAPYVWQRSYAAKSGKTVKKLSGTLGPFYAFAVMLPVMLVGFGGAILFPEIANSDNILIETMAQYAPLWGIFIVVGIVAAGMSTISSIVVCASSLFTMDFYVKDKEAAYDEKKVTDVGRITIVVLMVTAIILSLMDIKGIVLLVNTALGGFCQYFFAVVGVFNWKRATKEGVTVGLIAGIVVTLYTTAIGATPFGFAPGLIGLVVNGILFVVVSLMTKPIPEERIEEYMLPLTSRETLSKESL